MRTITTLLLLLVPAALICAEEKPRLPINGDWAKVQVVRFAENPLIRPGMAGLPGRNINGPSLIKVPSWVPKPLGRYYIYFADHGGKYIRLAYANDLRGPWTIHTPGVLHLEQTAAKGHIASPEVLIDESTRQIRMYFHGPAKGGQMSFVALSSNGLDFTAKPDILAPFYLRVFRHDDWWYGVAKNVNESGVLLRSRDGLSPFERGPDIIYQMRHCALLKKGETLYIFFTRIGDAPEQIILTTFDLTKDWKTWESTARPYLPILKPEMDYEGIEFPPVPSRPGAQMGVRQLRDPHVYEEDGRLYLFYSVAGELGIAGAELKIDPAPR